MYLTGHACRGCTPALTQHPRAGLMAQPATYSVDVVARWARFAADNGGFGDKFDPAVWLPWLDRIAIHGPMFVVVPDRFDPDDLAGNHAATMRMWQQWAPEVLDRGMPAAFVAQNGCTPDDIPGHAAAVFIGGDTRWKLSEQAWAVVAAGRAHGQWVHMGRVNTWRRFNAAYVSGVHSADGTLLKHGCNANLPKLLGFLDRTDRQPSLGILGGTS